jgi:hypothetical protein
MLLPKASASIGLRLPRTCDRLNQLLGCLDVLTLSYRSAPEAAEGGQKWKSS